MSDLRVVGAGELVFEGKSYRCAIGAGGFRAAKREGDKATPTGSFALRGCWYRADRMPAPRTGLPLRVIGQGDGWCDAPEHPAYNTSVSLPFLASHEMLWREDNLYDALIPIGFNDDPVIPGKGSAIFLHLARSDYSPTEGCVAISLPDMLEILPRLSTQTCIRLGPS